MKFFLQRIKEFTSDFCGVGEGGWGREVIVYFGQRIQI